MILIDTNILVYAATESDPRQPSCRAFLEGLDGCPHEYCTTWPNVFEFLRVVTHPKALPVPLGFDQALEDARGLVASIPMIHPGPRHLDYVARVARDLAPVRGDRVFDCRIAAILLENGGSRILSYDTRLRRVKGIEVLTPD